MGECPEFTHPTAGFLEFENGNVVDGSFDRVKQDVHPPGFDGTLFKHMGETKRPITIRGILESPVAGSAPLLKKAKFEDASDEDVGTLEFFGITYKKVWLKKMRWLRYFAVLRDGSSFIDIEYEAELVQLKDE